MKLHRFQGCSSIIRHLCVASCVHHPKLTHKQNRAGAVPPQLWTGPREESACSLTSRMSALSPQGRASVLSPGGGGRPTRTLWPFSEHPPCARPLSGGGPGALHLQHQRRDAQQDQGLGHLLQLQVRLVLRLRCHLLPLNRGNAPHRLGGEWGIACAGRWAPGPQQ